MHQIVPNLLNLQRAPDIPGFQGQKKGRRGIAAPLIETEKMCYLPFLPPPLSSFLPFFFMEAPSVALRIPARSPVDGCLKLIYERAARLSRNIRVLAEKDAIEAWRPVFRRCNSGRGS